MKKHRIKKTHEYEIVKAKPGLVMRRAWYRANLAVEKFGGKASEYLSECLKIVWRDYMADITATNNEILAARKAYTEKRLEAKEREANIEYAAMINKNAPRRRLVAADKYSEGDKLGNFIVTGLGREFRPNADMFSLGITPDTDYVQYAYFN